MNTNLKNLAAEAAQKYLSIVKGVSLSAWMEIWSEAAVVEFPYAPDPYPKRLEGKPAILTYYSQAAPQITLQEEGPLTVYSASDPYTAVFEISLAFRNSITDKDYLQNYISVIKVATNGKILLYREYWDPIRALKAYQNNEVKL